MKKKQFAKKGEIPFFRFDIDVFDCRGENLEAKNKTFFACDDRGR